jgi:hypothetical protein
MVLGATTTGEGNHHYGKHEYMIGGWGSLLNVKLECDHFNEAAASAVSSNQISWETKANHVLNASATALAAWDAGHSGHVGRPPA